MGDSALNEADVESFGDGEDYRPVISSDTNYHKFLQLFHSDSIYEEDFDAELRSNGRGEETM